MAPKTTKERSLRGGRRRPNNSGHSAAPSISNNEHRVSLAPHTVRSQFPQSGASFWNHPLAKFISRERKITDVNDSCQYQKIYIQNNVIGFVVRGIYRDASGVQQEVVPRRVCTKTMWRDLGVFYNSRRFAGARVRPKLSPHLFGECVDEQEWQQYCDKVEKAGGSPTLLVFKSLRMTLVGLPSFDEARLVANWWSDVIQQYFAEKLPNHPPISFFATGLVLDNCVCTSYVQTKSIPLNLEWIHRSVPHSNFNKALFPMLTFRYRFTIPVEWRLDKTKEETMSIVVLLSSSAKILFTKLVHPFFAVLAMQSFRRDVIAPFLSLIHI